MLFVFVLPWIMATVVTSIVLVMLWRRWPEHSLQDLASFYGFVGFVSCVIASWVLGKWLLGVLSWNASPSGPSAAYRALLIWIWFPLVWGSILIAAARLLVRVQPGRRTLPDSLRYLGLGAMPAVFVYPVLAAWLP